MEGRPCCLFIGSFRKDRFSSLLNEEQEDVVRLDDRKSLHLARISFVALSSLPQGSGFHCGGESVHFLIQVTQMLSAHVYETVSILHSTMCNVIHLQLKKIKFPLSS